ncbi:Ig-like domain-containing protein [Listeria booriae]|uniref:Bacterial Ig domain-containing protein n=1 Tax=Listeria booriae TaxID=1552123 RepID=A0A7X0XMG5_9LIST|nr:Ig-like domain-containing protein [Listeria booriae]MBC1563761.1 hypothetical protein [Listeria booriae]
MSKNQTMKKVAMAVVAANVVASSLITAMPAKSMAAENQGTETGNKAEQKLTSGLKSAGLGATIQSINLIQNPNFQGNPEASTIPSWSTSAASDNNVQGGSGVSSFVYDAVSGQYTSRSGSNDLWNNYTPQSDGIQIKHTTKDSGHYIAYLGQDVTVVKGQQYQLSTGYQKVSGTDQVIAIRMINYNDDGTINNMNSTEWTRVSNTTRVDFNKTVTATSSKMRIEFKQQTYNAPSDTAGTTGTVKIFSPTLKNTDQVAPLAPTTNDVFTNSSSVSGTTEANATVSVKANGTEIGTAQANNSGAYTVTIPEQAYNTPLQVTAQDIAGNISDATTVNVKQAPIATPTINPLTSRSTTASGTGEAGSTLTFKANGIEYPATVTSNGTWSVTIPKQAANTSVEATSVLNGVSSAKATASISYEGPSTPTLDNVTNTSTRVTGTGDSGNIITIKVKTGDSTISYSGTIDDAGKFSIDIDAPDAGAIVEAVAQDNTGTDSQNVTTTVLDVIAPDAPKVNAVKSTDTIISGTGEANCDVTVKLPSGGIIQGRINSQGAFSITIPKQAVGAKIEVSLTDAAGNKGNATTVTVQADTLAAPTINDYYATAGYVTGSAPAGASKIALYIDNQLVRYGAIDSNGKYQIYAADNAKMNTAGTAFQVVAIDANGNMSTKANATVQAKIAAPSIQDYYTTDAYAKGVATGASKVTLYVNGKAVRTAAVNADGNYSVYTGDQASLTTVGANFQISATNAAGMESAKTAGTVKSKLTAPVINKYAATDAYARGTAAAGSKQVVLYVDGKAVRTAAVNADGTYAIYTGDQVALTVAGNTFQIASKDAVGNESPKATGTVVSVLAAPTIATYYTTDVYAKGTTPAGATKVALYVDGKFVRYATVTDGKFSIYTGDQAKLATAGSTFQLASVDAKGTIGNMVTATVQADNRVAYQLTATGFDMAKDQNVSGTAGSSITRVKIFVNGDVKRQTSVANGAYAIYAKDVITSASDTVEIAGYDAQGFERSRVTVPVTSVAPVTNKTITPADYTIGTDSITGTIDSDIKKVQLFVNDVLARQAAISGNSFTVYAADKVTSASQKVEMVGFDASGAEIARQAVNVK